MKHTASTRSGFAARNDQMVSSMALWLVVVVAVRWWLRSLAGSVSGAEQVFIGSADPSRDGEKTNVVHGNFSRVTLSATPMLRERYPKLTIFRTSVRCSGVKTEHGSCWVLSLSCPKHLCGQHSVRMDDVTTLLAFTPINRMEIIQAISGLNLEATSDHYPLLVRFALQPQFQKF